MLRSMVKIRWIWCLIVLVGFGAATLVSTRAEARTPKNLKKLVAVNDFENKSGYGGQWELGTGMADMLTDSLMQSGKFIVLERQILDDVVKEQNLAASGRTSTSKTAQVGKITSSQILIQGAVTEFEENTGGGGQGLNIRGLSVGMDRSSAHVAIIIRLVDSTTGEVLDSQRVEGKAEGGGLKFGVSTHGVGFGSSGFDKTPVGKATQIAIDNAVEYVARRMESIPWQAKVVTVKESTVYVNCGENSGVSIGDTFTVYRKGESLIDPDTGIDLGSEDTKIGNIEITSVDEKFSKAAPVTGTGFDKGDIVRTE